MPADQLLSYIRLVLKGDISMTTLEKTTHDQMNMAAMETQGYRTQSLASKIGRFIWHMVQMIVAMEAGMMIYHHLLWPVLAHTTFSTLTDQYPLLGYWAMVASMTLPMIALMRIYHKSSWRYCLGMSTAMLAPLATLTVLVLCYLFPIHTLYGVGDPVMILAMAAYMLYRPHQHMHSGHEHAGHQHASSIKAETTGQTTDQLNEVGEENQTATGLRTSRGSKSLSGAGLWES
jgi:hypothetical protein